MILLPNPCFANAAGTTEETLLLAVVFAAKTLTQTRLFMRGVQLDVFHTTFPSLNPKLEK